MVIDLRRLKEPLIADIRKSLRNFSNEHPQLEICTVGICGDGFHGTASLHLDTPEHAAAFVKEWAVRGKAWYGEDHSGRFCNSCWDFPHCIGEFAFPGYPDLYDAEDSSFVDYVTLDGSTERVELDEEGNEGLNRVVFPFLKAVLTTFEPFSGLVRCRPFRIGVQMRDSLFVEFWVSC